MPKEDSVQLRMETRGKRVPNGKTFPKARHGYDSPKRIKDRMKYLGECQALPLNDKFAMSVKRFREVSKKVKKIFIGWSGGKDSTLVIDIAVASGVDNYEIVYADSGVEPVETIDYVALFSQLRGFDYKTLKAPTSFWQMTKTHGWPILGGDRFSLTKKTVVIDRVGLLFIGDALTNDMGAQLLGDDGWSDCCEAHKYYKDNQVVVSLRSGLELKGSEVHRVKQAFNVTRSPMFNVDWIEIQDLKEGDWVLVEAGRQVDFEGGAPLKFLNLPVDAKGKPYLVKQPAEMTSDLAWLIGFFDGDGTFENSDHLEGGVSFYCSAADKLMVETKMKNVFDLTSNLQERETKIVDVESWRLCYYRKNLSPVFEKMCLRGAKEILRYGLFFKDYLFGRIQSDGNRAGKNYRGKPVDWQITTVREEDAELMQQMGFMSGFWVRRADRDRTGEGGIGVNGTKISHSGVVWELWLTPMIEMNYISSLSSSKRLDERLFRERGFCRKLRDGSKSWLIEKGLRIDQVAKVEKKEGNFEYRDVTLDAPHSFVSNGFISHNCMGGGWQANGAKARREGDEIRALAIERAMLSGACSNVLKVVPMDRYARYVGSDCIVGGSLVTTRFGLEEIKEIPGELELEGGGVWTQSNNKLVKEGLEVVRVTLRNGLELSGSLGHKVKIPVGLQRRDFSYEEKWKSLGSLEEGDDVLIRAGGVIEFEEEASLELVQTADNLVYPTKMTSELAWLIGFFDSDGSYRKTAVTKERCGIKFNCSEADLSLVQERMKKVFGLTQESYPVPIKLGGVRHEQVYYRMGLVPIFEKLALRDLKGILKFGNYYRDYLFGRIQGDGSKAESIGGWRVFISDENQSQIVQQMGFVSGFWARRGWEESERYELGGIYTIYLTPMISMNPVNHLSENKIPGVERVKERGLTRKGQSIRALSRERLKQEGLRINWVVKVERLESEPLFDTMMEAPHAYTSNGFVSHNCTSMGLMALETRQRMLVWLQKGDFYWHKSNKKWIFWPIATWKPDDVMKYFRSNNIPMCALYDPGRLVRNGCCPCGKSWKWPDNNWMDTYRFHPEVMDEYMMKRGLAQKLLEIKKLYHADQLMRFGIDDTWSGEKAWEHYPLMMLQL